MYQTPNFSNNLNEGEMITSHSCLNYIVFYDKNIFAKHVTQQNQNHFVIAKLINLGY